MADWHSRAVVLRTVMESGFYRYAIPHLPGSDLGRSVSIGDTETSTASAGGFTSPVSGTIIGAIEEQIIVDKRSLRRRRRIPTGESCA
jgi:hypothetical protein